MEGDNLRTASLYINNQLLSRGLLRNGQTIDFARPDKEEGGLEGTMGRIMSVVNDLILRRDRDATQRETLTNSLRALRSDSLRQTTDLERLQTKNVEAQRRIGIADATERALKQQLKSADQIAKGTKDEMARMKVLVQQTRNQCAVEVRKRERVIEGLKKHVGDGRVRGGGKSVGTREIIVVPGVGSELSGFGCLGAGLSTKNDGYDLRSETNEFLTELARGLSEENENLAALARRTVETLKTSSGWEREGMMDGEMVIPVEVGCDGIASEMHAVIEHVQTLLTNPSFVPLEEVEIREEEIIRLREGWERMESRWREAVLMMEGWRKRMASNGQTVNLDELRMGLMLSPLKTKDQEERNAQLSILMEEVEDEGDTQADIDAMDEEELAEEQPEFEDDIEDSDSSLFEEEPLEEQEQPAGESEEEQEQEEPGEEEDHGFSLHTESSISIGPPPQLSTLKEISGNRTGAPSPPNREKDEGFSTIMEENTYDLLQLQTPSPVKLMKSVQSTPQRSTNTQEQLSAQSRRQQKPTTKAAIQSPSEDELSLFKPTPHAKPTPKPTPHYASPRKVSRPTPTRKDVATPRLKTAGVDSRLPRPRDGLPQQSPLTLTTIAAKLAASEREADAARVRAKIKAARANRVVSAARQVSGIGGESGSARSSTNADRDGKMMPPPSSVEPLIRLVPREESDEEVGTRGERNGGHEHKGVDRDGEKEREREKENEMKGKKRRAPIGRTGRDMSSRRRSTLSGWELESLMQGVVGSPSKE